MSNAKHRQSNWIVTLSLAAIAIAYMVFVWLPGRREIREVGDQIETKQQFVAQATGLTKTLTSSRKELEATNAVVKKWMDIAPRNRDLPALFGRINALAKESGLAVARFDPEPFVVHEEIREIPLVIGCLGKFSQMFDFLMKIESLPRSIWVDGIRLEKQPGINGSVKGDITLVIFSGNLHSSDYTTRER